LNNKTDNKNLSYFSSLAYPDFLRMWLAGLFAGSSHWALIVVRGWVVYQISDSSMYVGLVTFAAMIPMVLVNPFIGYLADKFQRRRILQLMFFINFVHNLGLAILYFFDLILAWHLVILAFIQGSARAAQMPSGQALVPNIVPKENLLNAVALNMSTVHATRLLGPLAVAPFLSYIGSNENSINGTDLAFSICTGFYALSFIFSLMIKNKSTGKVSTESFFVGFVEGIKYVHSNKPILIIIGLTTLHCMLTMSFESVLPYFSVNKLDGEGLAVSFLMMCVGIGALIASIFLAGTTNERLKGKLFYYYAILSGIAPIALGLSTNLYISLFATVLMGLGQAGYMIISHTIIQMMSPDYVRGRIAGVYAMYIGGSMALFNFLNGLSADFIDPGYSLAIQGIIFTLIVIIYRNQNVLSSIYSGNTKEITSYSKI
jgi:MFS family permease|tara:strand:+ start:582 stop:1871 length:1290 start_codon:yes stop_codon:yes gene_type:complete